MAQRHNWERMGDRFSGKHAELDMGEIGVIIAACAAAGLLLWLLQWAAKWQEGKLDSPSPGRLFRDLCRAHKLRWRERRLLKQLASDTNVDHPVELFLKPEAFNIGRIPASLEAKATAVVSLSERLFAEPPVTQTPVLTNQKAEITQPPVSAEQDRTAVAK